MAGSPNRTDTTRRSEALVGGLAQAVIGQLVHGPTEIRQQCLQTAASTLYQAALQDTPCSTQQLRADLSSQKISDTDLHDFCIAKAARLLGEDWVNDVRSFAEVSKASAWLYGLCKELGEEWDNLQPPDGSQTILLATLEGEGHLIGPAALAHKMRRSGNSVLLSCNARASDLADRLVGGDFDCLMLSSASQVGLESVGQAVRSIRQRVGMHVPIVLGGAVLEFCGNLPAKVGVDLIANDEKMALRAIRNRSQTTLCVGAAE